jgi:O-antigen/teichoic acid export membrane protein
VIKKLSSNILIYGGTNVIKSLVPFLMLPILTLYLSVEDYGVLSLVEVSILFLAPFISLNINSAINIEFYKLNKVDLKQYITNAIFLSFIVLFICLFLVFLFQSFILKALGLSSDLILWLPIFAFLRIISSVVLGLYQVSDNAKKFAYFTFFQTFIDFVLSYLLVVFYKFGYLGRLEGIYIALSISTILGIYILQKQQYFSFKIVTKYSKEILSYGVPLIPHVLGGVVLAMSDRYFISYFIDNEQVGYYSVAYQISALMLLVGVSVNQAWSPMLFRYLKDIHLNQDKIKKITFILFGLFLIAGISIYFLSDFIFSLLVDEKFYQAKEYFPYLLIGFVFQSFYYLITNYLFFYKKTVLLAKLTFSSALVNIVLNYLFIIKYGVIGVAYATAITYVVYFIVVFIIVNRLIKNKLKGDL